MPRYPKHTYLQVSHNLCRFLLGVTPLDFWICRLGMVLFVFQSYIVQYFKVIYPYLKGINISFFKMPKYFYVGKSIKYLKGQLRQGCENA